MTIHTVRPDIITAIEQYRHDTITITITIRIMAIAIVLTITIMAIAISRSDHHISDHLRRSVIIDLPQREVVDKKYNKI